MSFNSIQLAALQADFQAVAANVRSSKLLSSLKFASKPILLEAKRRTPVNTGASRRSLTWKKESISGFFGIRLMGDYKFQFLEKGTKPRSRKSGGSTGSGPAYFIQRGAFDSKKDEAINNFNSALRRKIDLYLRK